MGTYGQGGRLHRRDPTMRLGGQLMYSAHPILSDIHVHRRQRRRGHRDPDPPMFDLQGSINVLNPRNNSLAITRTMHTIFVNDFMVSAVVVEQVYTTAVPLSSVR